MARCFPLVVALSLVGCAAEEPAEELGRRAAGLTPVAWTDLVGVSAAINDLTKTAPESAWNAGAVSVESLSGDGFVEFTTGEATTNKMAGLSNGNGGPDDADIDFALRLGSTGGVAVVEGGVSRGSVGSYVAGDLFRVQVEGGVVTYWQNGGLLYTSTGVPSFPLLVDTSLRTQGATVNDAVVVSQAFWNEVVGASEDGNDLVKTAPQDTWAAGAVSAASLTGDGYLAFTTGESTTAKMAGLSSGNGGTNRADIDFGIQLSAAGAVSIHEAGVLVGGFGQYAAGDRFRIEVEDGVVTYWRNGGLVHTSADAPSFPLLVDTSLKTPGATIEDVEIESFVFWQDAVNAAADRNGLVKTSPLTGWNAGATSVESIASGDCYVQFTTGENTTAKMAGLSNGNGGTGYSDIDYAIYPSAQGGVTVYEQGDKVVDIGGAYTAGDVFQIRVAGGVVSYWRNGVQFHTSTASPTYPLLLDTSLRTPGASLLDAVIEPGAPPECTPVEQSLYGAEPSEGFGSFEVEGDVLAVLDRDSDATAVQVYRRSGGGWAFEQALAGPAVGTPSQVATDGHTIAMIVSPADGSDEIARVYRHDGIQWLVEGDLQPCAEDRFGFFSVAVRGDVLILSSSDSLVDGETRRGRLYVHRRTPSGSWALEGILTHPIDTGQASQGFFWVAVAGGWVATTAQDGVGVALFRYLAGAPDPSEPPSCANLDPGKWRYRQSVGPGGSPEMSPSGKRLVVASSELVHVYERTAGTWSETAEIAPYPVDADLGFGPELGGMDADHRAVIVSGERVFAENEYGGWNQIDVLPANIAFGVTADQILVGDSSDDTGGTDAGAIHILDMEPVCFGE